jgi:hypothetical protein
MANWLRLDLTWKVWHIIRSQAKSSPDYSPQRARRGNHRRAETRIYVNGGQAQGATGGLPPVRGQFNFHFGIDGGLGVLLLSAIAVRVFGE